MTERHSNLDGLVVRPVKLRLQENERPTKEAQMRAEEIQARMRAKVLRAVRRDAK